MLSLSRMLVLALALAVPPAAPAAERAANAIFLIASEDLQDPNFRETVVLVTQPRQGGPWGVIINRPLRQRLSEIFTDQETLKGRKEVVFFGGPVEREGLVFVVRSSEPPPRSVALVRGVYFTGDVEWIEAQFKRPEPTRDMRVYAGHAGWAPGQLQREIERGGWYVYPADAETVFDTEPSRIWRELIDRATTKGIRYSPGG